MQVEINGKQLRSTYGDLMPVKFQSQEKKQFVFVYPKTKNDPEALNVKESFLISEDGFSSVLGRVEGTMYIGRHSAGGYGRSLDLDEDGNDELFFNKPCGFIAQLRGQKITALESDTDITLILYGKSIVLKAFQPYLVD